MDREGTLIEMHATEPPVKRTGRPAKRTGRLAKKTR